MNFCNSRDKTTTIDYLLESKIFKSIPVDDEQLRTFCSHPEVWKGLA